MVTPQHPRTPSQCPGSAHGTCPGEAPRGHWSGSAAPLLGSAEGVRKGAQGGLGTPAGSVAEAGMQESTQAPGAWKGHFSPAGTSTSGLRCRKAG